MKTTNKKESDMKNMRKWMRVAALATVFGYAGLSRAAEIFWTGAGVNENWSTAANWSNSVAPVTGLGMWTNVTFDANTKKGRVYLNQVQGFSLLKLASGLTNNIVFNGTEDINMQVPTFSSAIEIASDSRDLTLQNSINVRSGGGIVPFTVGAGRMMTMNNAWRMYPGTETISGYDKKGAGTLVLAYPNVPTATPVTNSAGTLKTTCDLALNTANMTTSSGSTLHMGPTVQTFSRLSGNGTVMGADNDLVYAGTDGSRLISTNKNYVRKLAFAKLSPLTVNGVDFPVAGTSGEGYSLSGSYSTHAGDPARTPSYATGDYTNMLLRFYYNMVNPVLTFTNLTVGKRYEAVIFYNQGWGSRPQDVTCVNGAATTLWRGFQPANYGYFAYRFTAQATSASVAMEAHADFATFTWFGATLEDMTGVAPGSRCGTLVVANSSNCYFEGSITGELALVKSGSGTLTLGGVNTYAGSTIISNGTLKCQLQIPIVNPGFEYPVVPTNPGYAVMNNTAYFPGGTDGLAGGWSSTKPSVVGFSKSVLNATTPPEGLQTSWMQKGGGNLSQLVTVPMPGIYTLAFQAEGRGTTYGPQPMAVMIDGVTQTNWPVEAFSNAWWTNCLARLNFSAGTHLLTFTNTATSGTGNICIDEVSLTMPVASLPTNTALSLAGGLLDLNGVTQTVASISSGTGVASNGTLMVTAALYPGGLNSTGTLKVANLVLSEGAAIDWDYATGNSDTILVQETLSLPTHATVYVRSTEALPPRVTLFESGGIVAPGGVGAWTVSGGKPSSRVVLNGNNVQLLTSYGTLISVF
jgi:autotransporter-associated beta strand protein